MRVLLDTNALLWLLNDDAKLSVAARTAIQSATEVLISEVSLWEISIKITIGKLAPIPELHTIVRDLGFRRLSLQDVYLSQYEALPLIHRDPFDRMLIAQAIVEGATILTSDEVFKKYRVKMLSIER